jgi:hypothetical protein
MNIEVELLPDASVKTDGQRQAAARAERRNDSTRR